MSRDERRKPMGRVTSDALLPEDWPGKRLVGGYSRNVKENDSELLMPGWIKPEWVKWTKVTLIGRDPWGLTGVRYLLARSGTVRLRVLNDIPAYDSELADSDVIIWLRLRYDGLPELSGNVTAIRRQYPNIKQLVITDSLPKGMQRGQSVLSGVWVANGHDNVEILYKLLAQTITSQTVNGPLLSNVLSHRQWRVLLMRAAGLSTECIAQKFHFSYKTVSVHEVAIRERLGILNRVEYAWLQRSVREIIMTLPVLARLWGVDTLL